MRILVYSVLTLLFSCCSPVKQSNRTTWPDGRLEFNGFSDYVTNFVVDSYEYGDGVELDSLIVRFKKIKQDDDGLITLGKCFYRTIPTVHIDPRFWGSLSSDSKELLVYHELGHCLLNRSHVDRRLSIMNTPIPTGFTFAQNREYLVRELFDPDSVNSYRLTGAGLNKCRS